MAERRLAVSSLRSHSLRSHSLRGRLLWLLLASVAVVAAAQFYIAYRSALSEADEMFDYHMQQMAMALRAGQPVSSSGVAGARHGDDDNGDFLIQIWTADGVRVFESFESEDLPQLAVLGFSNVKARGKTYRVLSVQAASLTIQVAQNEAARREIAGRLALRTAAPVALMAPLLMLLVLWVVTQSLLPVARVRRQVAARQASDLSPVSEAGLPDEIRPLLVELNLLFRRVQDAFDAQQHFVADAAHELRSPLAALKLQLQGLQRADSDEARTLAITRLASGIDRATRLVEQLLVLARQEASLAAGAKPARVSLADICRLTLEETLAAAQEKSIDLGLGRADEFSIEGYPDALRILVRNLLDNAVKFCPQGGRIDLAVSVQGDVAELTVDDSGPGIPPEHRQRVLDRFYRINGAQTAGSGLGLAIVKSIAEQQGAELRLGESSSLGGLQVTVRFPIPARD